MRYWSRSAAGSKFLWRNCSILKVGCACGDISDLDMYLRHFADDKGVALEKLLQHAGGSTTTKRGRVLAGR